MTQPQFPGATQAPPGYPQQPGYYPPQAPQGYPQTPQGYPQGPPQGYQQAPQGYTQQPQQPQAPELAPGTLDAYFSQPSTGGGAALKFAAVGTTHVVVVSRPITDADVQQQTQRGTNLPSTFKDGRPKFVLKIPCTVPPSPDHPDGQAQWWCAGAARDELARAMAEAGAPAGVPEVGAGIQITKTGERTIPGLNPAAVYQVKYWRPSQSGPLASPTGQEDAATKAQVDSGVNGGQQAPQGQQPAYQTLQAYTPQQPPSAQQVYQQPPAPPQQPVYQQSAPQQAPQQPRQTAPQPPPPGPSGELNADQQALLAKLTAQQSG